MSKHSIREAVALVWQELDAISGLPTYAFTSAERARRIDNARGQLVGLSAALSSLSTQPAQAAPTGPIVTHLNMDPNASPETIEAVKDVVRAAYSYKPDEQPEKGLTRSEAQQLIQNMRQRCQAGQCDYAIAHPVQPSQAMMSTDYEALYELLCKGGEALGKCLGQGLLLGYHDAAGRNEKELWIGLRPCSTKESFIAECTRLRLEWVAPLPSQTEGMEIDHNHPEWQCSNHLTLEELKAGAWRDPISFEDAEKVADTPAVHEAIQNFSHDPSGDNGTEMVRTILEHGAALSLPRQKGDVEKDTLRLNWLDEVNQRSNKYNGTVYGWRYDINHNRAQLSDHHIPALSVREAIDQAMQKSADPSPSNSNP